MSKTERTRIAGILNAPEAKGREGLARHLAFETDVEVDVAIKLLKAAPKANGARTGRLDAAMRAIGNANVGAGAPEPEKGDTWKASVDRVAAGKSAGGHK